MKRNMSQKKQQGKITIREKTGSTVKTGWATRWGEGGGGKKQTKTAEKEPKIWAGKWRH